MDLLHACPADGEACEVAETTDLGMVRLLPCMRCRVMERAVNELRGTQLGKNERALLQRAGPAHVEAVWPNWPKEGVLVQPEPDRRLADLPPSRASEESLRRAARNLRDKGLLRVQPPANPRSGAKSRAWRTPVGEAVTYVFAQQLNSGGRLRWERGEELLVTLARLSPARLSDIYEERIEAVRTRSNSLDSIADALHKNYPDDDVYPAAFIAGLFTNTLDEVDDRFNARMVSRWRVSRLPTRASISVRSDSARRTVRRNMRRNAQAERARKARSGRD